MTVSSSFASPGVSSTVECRDVEAKIPMSVEPTKREAVHGSGADEEWVAFSDAKRIALLLRVFPA
jgi:hypothetical protein